MIDTTQHQTKARRIFWRYRIAAGALLIVAGMVIAVSMNRHEAQVRTEADRAQIMALQNEIGERRKIRDQQYKEQQAQLRKLEKLAEDQVRINNTQNDIIRALLRIKDNDPQLFEGVVLPTVREFNDAVGSDSKQRTVKGQGTSSSTKTPRPKPRQPKPDTPGPTPSKPKPVTLAPTPTTPAPTPVRPVTPPPTPPVPVVPVPPVVPTPRPPIINLPPILPTPPQPGIIVDPITGLVCRTALVCIPSIGL